MTRSRRDRHLIEAPTDKWRYACPNGHRSWSAYPGGFFCPDCAYRRWPNNGRHETLTDTRTGDQVARDDLEFRGRFWFLRG